MAATKQAEARREAKREAAVQRVKDARAGVLSAQEEAKRITDDANAEFVKACKDAKRAGVSLAAVARDIGVHRSYIAAAAK